MWEEPVVYFILFLEMKATGVENLVILRLTTIDISTTLCEIILIENRSSTHVAHNLGQYWFFANPYHSLVFIILG